MPFDMYHGELSDCIEHHEEYLLEIAARSPDRFPQLCTLYSSFYSDPVLQPDRANGLVHELIDLIDVAKDERKSALTAIVRLLSFFSAAVRNRQDIRCSSD